MSELTPQARENIQGIILSGYGHLPYTVYLFLKIQDTTKAKAWLRRSILPAITTAKPWLGRADGTKEKPESTLNIALTYQGMKVLNLPQHTLDTFSREFIEGMVTPKRSVLLGDRGDSAPENWEIGGLDNPAIHLLLILNGLELDKLQQQQDQLLPEQDNGVEIAAQEIGYRPEHGREHFGFRDSISQPMIAGSQAELSPDQQMINTGEFILGYPDQYGFFPSTPSVPVEEDKDNILPSFPGTELPGLKDFGRNGTYLVYRKLAQDVAGFWQFIAEQGRNVEGSPEPETMSLLASKLVGRWPSGTPLVLAPDKDNPNILDKNQFTYLPSDREGYACPVGAHIRRTNPRDSFLDGSPEASFKTSSRHRILRRGAFYGEPLFPLDNLDKGQVPLEIQDDGQPRGLHFVSINANIRRQFEFVQETWCNNPHFNGLYGNKDPIIGDNEGDSGQMTVPRFPLRKQMNHLPRFVTVKGGGYFFLPSLAAMQFLANH
jgi:Dyp-type peroxidase family